MGIDAAHEVSEIPERFESGICHNRFAVLSLSRHPPTWNRKKLSTCVLDRTPLPPSRGGSRAGKRGWGKGIWVAKISESRTAQRRICAARQSQWRLAPPAPAGSRVCASVEARGEAAPALAA